MIIMKENYNVSMHITPELKVYIGVTSNDRGGRWKMASTYRGNIEFANSARQFGNVELLRLGEGVVIGTGGVNAGLAGLVVFEFADGVDLVNGFLSGHVIEQRLLIIWIEAILLVGVFIGVIGGLGVFDAGFAFRGILL